MRKHILVGFFCFFLYNLSFSQVFDETIQKEATEKLKKMGITKEFRDSQTGIIVTSSIGNTIGLPEMHSSNHSSGLNFKTNRSLEFRVNYVKEDIVPFGAFIGFGITNVFYNTDESNFSDSMGIVSAPFTWIVYEGSDVSNSYKEAVQDEVKKHPFIDMGLSKNIGTTITVQLGCRYIMSGKKSDVYPLNYEEKIGLNWAVVHRNKNLCISVGQSIYFPYYKQYIHYSLGSEYVWDPLTGYGWQDVVSQSTTKLTPNLMTTIGLGYNF